MTDAIDIHELIALGNDASEGGRLAEAIAFYDKALIIDPASSQAHYNRGLVLERCGRKDDAEEEYRRTLAIEPHFVEAYNNLGNLLVSRGLLIDAIDLYQVAISLDPGYLAALNNLGNAYKAKGELSTAISFYRRAISSDSSAAYASSNLIMSLEYSPVHGREELFKEACAFQKRHCAAIPVRRDHANRSDPSRRIRVGYVSPDFKRHPVGFHLLPVLFYHDKNSFEIFCYSDTVMTDEMTVELNDCTDEWRVIAGRSDDEVEQMILADGIDILVDLTGHTASNRLLLFARKPAPVQVTWLGYFNTTGLNAMDYLVTDGITVPLGEERWFSEEVVRLPDGRFCYAPPSYAPDVAPLPAMRNGYITFGSFNNIAKVTSDVVSLWSRVLTAVSGSRLLLKSRSFDAEEVRAHFQELFCRNGIKRERLELRGSSDHFAMLREYGEVDIALDPFPFSGGLTSCEAMWMGVPVITLPCDRPISRQTRGFLRLLRMQELVARSPEQYVAIAEEYAFDTKRLARMRAGLRARMASSPLCDGKRFAGNLENAFREMWSKWCTDGSVGVTLHRRTEQLLPAMGESPEDSDVRSTAVPVFCGGRVADAVTASNLSKEVETASPEEATQSSDGAERFDPGAICEAASRMVAAGDLDSGESLFGSVLTRFPEHPRALHAMGVILFRRGLTERAVELITKAVTVKPDFSGAWNNLGNVLRDTDRLEEAAASYRRVLQIEPSHCTARANLGMVLSRLGNGTAALSLLQEALAADPGNAETIAKLGAVLLRLRRYDEAREHLELALSLRQDRPEIHYNLGISLAETGCLPEAEACYRVAVKLRPDYSQAWGNLALVLASQGKHDEALSSYRRALESKGRTAATHSGCLMFLNSMPDVTQTEIYEKSCQWEQNFAPFLNEERDFSRRSADPERRLRLGFVSPDFRRHPVSYYFEPLARALDRSRFEMFCYADVLNRDEVTTRIRELADRWIEITGLKDEQVAELVALDEIDILFDLAGHTADNRLALFSLKPAPVQATWLGYFNTTGLRAIDYLISDRITIPPGEEQWFAETVVRLPDSRFCYAPPSSAPEIASPPFLANGYITFGCFNSIKKITREVVALWSRVLNAVPGSRLLLKSFSFNSESTISLYRELFSRYGIQGEQLTLRKGSDHSSMLAQYGDVDIALDPFPYSGGLTSCEALWMGVPVITMPGRLPISRQTHGFLQVLGMEELVAENPDHYVDIAADLAFDRERLIELREKLRFRMLSSPLCDSERFARNMENACRKIWREWCLLRGPAPSESGFVEPAQPNREEPLEKSTSFRDKTGSAAAQNDLGIALFQQGQGNASINAFRAAISADPDFVPAYRNLGKAFYELGRFGEAVTALYAALSIDSSDAGCFTDLGNAFKKLGRLHDAMRSYRKALRCKPEFAEAFANLGNCLLQSGETVKALRTLRKASKLAPEGSPVHASLLMGLLYTSKSGERKIFTESRKWGEALQRMLPLADRPMLRSDIDSTRLRIGYVSPDFRRHSVAFFLDKVISCHNRDKVEVFCYANLSREDEVTEHFQRQADNWRLIHDMSDDEAARLVKQDNIDILVDLAGHTEGNRLGVFARRPAPVQVTWLGYPGTTGLPTMDYRLTDFVVDPEGTADRYHSERLVRLSGGFLCYAPPKEAPPVGPLPSICGQKITFGSFNNPAKLTRETLTCWSGILDRVPDSALLIKMNVSADKTTRKKWIEIMESCGIDPARVEVLPRESGFAAHLAMYGRINIALDSFPYNGTTTTCEALWMGVPVVTFRGERHSARVGASILETIGLNELIGETLEEYRDIAVGLAVDKSRLNALHSGLRPLMAASSLVDGRGFVERLESAYRGMVEDIMTRL